MMKLTTVLYTLLIFCLPLPFFAQQHYQFPFPANDRANTRTSEQVNERVNEAAGLPLLPSSGQWTGLKFERALKPHRLFFQGDKTRRNVFLEDRMIFQVPATELVMICGEDGIVSQLDIIYFNKGDSARSRSMKRDIRKSGAALKQLLKSLLGDPRKDVFGPPGLQNDVLAWTCGDVRFLLEIRPREHTILHVCYREETPKKIRKKDLQIHKKQFSDNVRTGKFGDVYLENIPMVNQGNKGYCGPATLERVLRYFGITNVNMHQLADAADTGRGGGTSFEAMQHSIWRLARNYGLKIYSFGEVKIDTLKRHIPQGIPVMWAMNVNPAFLQLMDESRRCRPRDRSPQPWVQSLRKYKLPQQGEGHLCLIVGFNETTDEIAVSNSWGKSEDVPAWIPLKLATRVSMKMTCVLVPRR